MCDRGRSGEHGCGRELARQVAEHADADGAGEQPEEPAQREAGDAVDRLAVVRIAVEDAAERRRVQRQRDPDQRDSPGEGALELERALPAARSGGLEQRVGVGGAQGGAVGRGEERAGTAVDHRFRRGDRDDDVRVGQGRVDPERAFAVGDLHELLALDVVHLDPAPEAACDLRRDEQLQLAMCGAACEASGHEQRLAVRTVRPRVRARASSPRSLSAAGRRRAGNRERGRLDDDRRPGASRDERLERLAGEWKAKRVADGGRHVRDRVDRRRRREHDRVLAGVDDCEPRAVRQREPGQGIAR